MESPLVDSCIQLQGVSLKCRLFKAIAIPQLFPRLPHAVKVQELWTEFLEIYLVLQSTTALDNERVKRFQSHVINWMTVFLSVYQTKHVTPYMHLLVSHIPQFLEMYGTLAPFSQQGLEKLNDNLTKDYFRSTNGAYPRVLLSFLASL